jgi:hypothetical protein
MRRLPRLAKALSRKWGNMKAAYALRFAWYNFCRVHQGSPVASAIGVGLRSHALTIEEMGTNSKHGMAQWQE